MTMARQKGERRSGAEQGNAAELGADDRPEAVDEAPPSDFHEFCAWADNRRNDGPVVTRIVHPDAPTGRDTWDGARSGYPISRGAAWVQWSDGSVWPEVDSTIATS